MSSVSSMGDLTSSLVSPAVPSCLFEEGSPIKLGILASGSGSNFEAIAAAIQEQKLNAQIQVLIYNNPDAKVVERANRFNVPAVLHNHRHFKSREALDEQIVKTFQENGVEWVVMVGWMRIVTEVLLKAFPGRVLNIHPSLLPSFPGINGVEQALAAGVKITGCTVHFAELKVDSGPIIMQAAVPVFPDDTPETLHARIQVEEHKIIVAALALISSNN